jgi:signal transduction histidine kinase
VAPVLADCLVRILPSAGRSGPLASPSRASARIWRAGNLLDNAFKWAAGRIAVAVVGDGDRLRVIIDDDGPGLSGAEIARAVQPGTRLDATTAGDGFGLAIAADLAGLYGGALALDRAPAGGLRVRLELPAAP